MFFVDLESKGDVMYCEDTLFSISLPLLVINQPSLFLLIHPLLRNLFKPILNLLFPKRLFGSALSNLLYLEVLLQLNKNANM